MIVALGVRPADDIRRDPDFRAAGIFDNPDTHDLLMLVVELHKRRLQHQGLDGCDGTGARQTPL